MVPRPLLLLLLLLVTQLLGLNHGATDRLTLRPAGSDQSHSPAKFKTSVAVLSRLGVGRAVSHASSPSPAAEVAHYRALRQQEQRSNFTVDSNSSCTVSVQWKMASTAPTNDDCLALMAALNLPYYTANVSDASSSSAPLFLPAQVYFNLNDSSCTLLRLLATPEQRQALYSGLLMHSLWELVAADGNSAAIPNISRCDHITVIGLCPVPEVLNLTSPNSNPGNNTDGNPCTDTTSTTSTSDAPKRPKKPKSPPPPAPEPPMPQQPSPPQPTPMPYPPWTPRPPFIPGAPRLPSIPKAPLGPSEPQHPSLPPPVWQYPPPPIVTPISSPVVTPVAGTTSSGSLSASDIQTILTVHNQIRQNYQVQPLQWSPTLAAAAQSWADNCMFAHSTMPYGENIALSDGDMDSTVRMWYDTEVCQYSYANPGFTAGHFTQMVWASTRSIGCGIASPSSCPNGISIGAGGQTRMGVMLVCEYDPPGNMGNAYRANVFPPLQPPVCP